jgi:chemotaxis receptor (MCP) glutamine deamidase CheD
MGLAGKNVLVAHSSITSHGRKIDAEGMGGNEYRQLILDIWSGYAWVRKPDAHYIS